MNQKSVWRVCGTLGNGRIFEAYFTDRDTAHAVYHKGEREYGMAAGYTQMHWSLEGFYLDNDPHIDQMFNDITEEMKNVTENKDAC